MEKINIGAQGIMIAISSVQASSTLLQTYVWTVLKSPDLTVTNAEGKETVEQFSIKFTGDQKQARVNANEYLLELNEQLLQQISNMLGYINLWNAEFPHLMNLAKKMSSDEDAEEFKSGVKNLIDHIRLKRADTLSAESNLTKFLPSLIQNQKELKADAAKIAEVLGGDEGEIQALRTKLAEDNAVINECLETISKGASTTLIGIAMIIIGLIEEVESEGISSGLAIAGIKATIGSVVDFNKAIKLIEETTAEMINMYILLKKDEQLYLGTNQLLNNVTSQITASQIGVKALSSLQMSWDYLENAMSSFVDLSLEQLIEQKEEIVDIFQKSGQSWEEAHTLTVDLQKTGALPVSVRKYQETIKS